MTDDGVEAGAELVHRFGSQLAHRLDDFWDAWAGVAADPASPTARAVVATAAHEIASGLNEAAEVLVGSRAAYRSTLDTVAAALADTVNAALVDGFDLDGVRGTELFRGATAADLAVDRDVAGGLAASGVRGGGLDNRIATELSQAALRPGSADSIVLALIGSVATNAAAAIARVRTTAAVRSYTDLLGAADAEVDATPARDAATRQLAAIDTGLAGLRTHTDRPADSSGRSIAAARRATAHLPTVLSRLSAGHWATEPADDPDAFVAALASRSAARRARRYVVAADDALDWLRVTDAAYAGCLVALHQVHTADTAEAFGAVVGTAIRHANATCRGRPVFGGATAGATAYDESGTYLGSAGSVLHTVAPRTSIDVAVHGPDVFGTVFANLRKITGTLVLQATLDDVDAAVERVRAAQDSSAEMRERLLRLAAARHSSRAERARQPRSLDEVDRAELVVRVAAAEVAYRSAAQTLSGVERESLREFLR